MEKMDLIRKELIAQLSDSVFNQHFDHSSEQGFTDSLTEEEELAIVKQMLVSATAPEWLNFLQNYIKHYALFNSSVDLLIDNSENPVVREALVNFFECSGPTVAQTEKVCRYFLRKDAEVYPEVMVALCDHARSNDKNIAMLLDQVEDKFKEEHSNQPAPQYSTRYVASVSSRRSRV
ncbi:MAG: hypothetical protein IJ778_00080 [Alphaproteobacteria bacterium]|nr:hypothetical protein [Alphaproteobacteria bacterium]